MNDATTPDSRDIRFFTVDQIAMRWQTSKKTVRRRIESGALTIHRFGSLIRVSYSDLIEYERTQRED